MRLQPTRAQLPETREALAAWTCQADPVSPQQCGMHLVPASTSPGCSAAVGDTPLPPAAAPAAPGKPPLGGKPKGGGVPALGLLPASTTCTPSSGVSQPGA